MQRWCLASRELASQVVIQIEARLRSGQLHVGDGDGEPNEYADSECDERGKEACNEDECHHSNSTTSLSMDAGEAGDEQA